VAQRRGRPGEAARAGDFPQHGEAVRVELPCIELAAVGQQFS
jgi:hypothetical protein